MNITDLRRNYHKDIVEKILHVNKPRDAGGYPNFADTGSAVSVELAWGIVERLVSGEARIGKIPGQTAGSRFEVVTRDYLDQSFSCLQHLRPGSWSYECRNTKISRFVQYNHLSEIEAALRANKALKAAFGGNYVVGPDIVVSREPVTDIEIDKAGILKGAAEDVARYTPFRAKNQGKRRPLPLLHAVISCKWTVRNDRAQNTKTEVLNLIRNRKGNLPHIVAVTAEPLPSRIAALALGTGDLDCVYHFALNELMSAVADSPYLDAAELLQMMVDGKRLRDISDLPFDLAV